MESEIPIILQETNRTSVVRLPNGTVKKTFKNITNEQFNNVMVATTQCDCAIPIHEFDHKQHFYVMPYYPIKLTDYIKEHHNKKDAILQQLADAVFEIWSCGWVHNDFHSNNIFVFENRILIGDWEHVRKRSNNGDSFLKCQDLIGGQHTHAFWDKDGEVDIGKLLNASSNWVVKYVKEKILKELSDVSGAYWERNSPGQIYGNIYLKDFQVEGRRNPKERLDAFGVDFKGKTVLDVGSNTGSITFEAYNRGASHVSGIELRLERTKVASTIAAFTGIDFNVNFCSLDILKYEIVPYQIVICLSVDHQVEDPRHLYKCLYDTTLETLLFETSKQREELNWVKENLLKVGFSSVKYIGDSAASDKKSRSRHMFLVKK